MLVQKDEKKMNVSPKAFRLLYKEQGYEEVTQDAQQDDGDALKDLKKMKKDELKALAIEKGIEGCEDMSKEQLFEILKDVV